jgi:hypothetical protein
MPVPLTANSFQSNKGTALTIECFDRVDIGIPLQHAITFAMQVLD